MVIFDLSAPREIVGRSSLRESKGVTGGFSLRRSFLNSGFTPAVLSSVRRWYKATPSGLNLSGSLVNSLMDLKDSGENFTPEQDASRPTYDEDTGSIVFNNPITGTSTNPSSVFYLRGSQAILNNYPFSVFMVLNDGGRTASGAVISVTATIGEATHYDTLYINWSDVPGRIVATSRRSSFFSATLDSSVWSEGQFNMVKSSWLSTSSRTITLSADSTASNTATVSVIGTSGASWIGVDRIPNNTFPCNSYRGSIKEIIITGAITQEEEDKIWGYLAHEHNLTSKLPSGHPYKNSPP